MTKTARKIAIVFDFDDTLAPDSTSSFLEAHEVDVKDFWKRHKMLLSEGWDPIPAYLDMMIQESVSRPPKHRFTRQAFEKFGRSIRPHKGLPHFFGRVQDVAKDTDPNAQVLFFVVSSGIHDIISVFPHSEKFAAIWGSNFAYNERDEICGVKNVISFTDKTRYLFEIQKGTFLHSPHDPFAVNKKVPESAHYVKFNHMIMVGDGFTDIPCFSLVEKNGGVAIGVYERDGVDRWGRAWGLLSERRVNQMVAADFSKRSGLDDAICLAVRSILTVRGFA